MTNQKVLSVTVPSYNAQQWLNKGIPTFLEESILNKIEVLIVDDGSADKTAEISRIFEKQYPGTVKYINKENGGHGSAVNTGIKEASGEYFMVVDSDDYVDTNNFIKLVEKLEICTADLVLTDAAIVDIMGNVTGYEKVKGIKANQTAEFETVIKKIPNMEMHNYCIRTGILKKYNICCHEHHFYVDNEYVLYPLMYVNDLIYFDFTVYQYLVGREGQSVSIERRRRNMTQYLEVADYLKEYYYENRGEMSKEKRNFYERKIAYFISGVYSVLLSYNTRDRKQELIQFDMSLKADKEIYCANRNVCIKILRMSGFTMYHFCAWVYRMVNGIR